MLSSIPGFFKALYHSLLSLFRFDLHWFWPTVQDGLFLGPDLTRVESHEHFSLSSCHAPPEAEAALLGQHRCPALHLTVVTFGLLAPLACHRLLHSYFYLRHWHLNQMSQEFLQQSLKEGEAALHYFEELPSANGSVPIVWQATLRPWLVITIITVDRQPGFHYALQVVSQFHRLLQQCGPQCEGHQLFLCNVERSVSHFDAKLLSKYVPRGQPLWGHRGWLWWRSFHQLVWEREAGLRLLSGILPADLQPRLRPDGGRPSQRSRSFQSWNTFCGLASSPTSKMPYLKLYHPPRGSSTTSTRSPCVSWSGSVAGMLLGPLLTWIYMCRPAARGLAGPPCSSSLLYSMGLVELVGRHYFLERGGWVLPVQGVPASQCCTPAMLFPAPCGPPDPHLPVPGLLPQGFGKDMALVLTVEGQGERAYGGAQSRETHWTLLQPSVQLSPQSALACQEMPSWNWPLLGDSTVELFIWTWLLADNSLF